MVYESMSLLELRKAAKEKNLKGISSLKKQELIEYLKNNDNEHKQSEPEQETKAEQTKDVRTDRVPRDIKSLDSGRKANGILEVLPDGYGLSAVRIISPERMISMYHRPRSGGLT